MTLRLDDLLRPEIGERQARELYDDVELPLLWVLADMEESGILVDREVFATISTELAARAEELEARVYKEAGREFNIGSTQQLGAVLFEDLGLPATKRTKTGYSTSAGALADLAPQYPIVEDVLEWRHVNKLKSTYVDALPELVNPDTGRIHTSWGQTSVVTGRLSSRDPNLQNIPVRSEVGGQIRRGFVAPEGRVLLAADYSQMELRILAALSGDPSLTEVFEKGGDVHAATGAFLFDKPADDVSSNERRIAKMVNFGVLYGMGAFGLSQRTGLPRADSQAFIDRYFSRYSSVKGYFESVVAKAADVGYVETILGRRRYFPELAHSARVDHAARRRAEREAINAPIQGSAADITKVAMIDLHKELAQGDRGSLLLQVHDELLLEVPVDALDEVGPLVRSVMCSAVDLAVDLEVDLSVGPSWAELERLD
jgi:DNA polymerase-1